MNRIHLSFNPYTYARVAVMKAQLFKKQDYDQILKMGFHEALRYVQDSHFQKEMEQYNVMKEGLTVIEQALNLHLMNSFKKLFRISDEKMQKVLSLYLLRYDVENIKAILRSKAAHVSKEETRSLLYPSVNFNTQWYEKLLQAEDVIAVMKQLTFLGKPAVQSLFEAENILDYFYVNQLHELSHKLSGEGKTVAAFLQEEIDIINIHTIMRLLEDNALKSSQYVMHPSSFISSLLKISTPAQLRRALAKKGYIESEQESIADMEKNLMVTLLQKQSKLISEQMLSVNVILGYLFAKEIEVRNLKMILKAKKLHVSPETIQPILVIP